MATANTGRAEVVFQPFFCFLLLLLQSFQVNNHKPACLRSADVLVLLAGLLFFADDQVSQRGLAGVSAAVELL